jgi:hypothetical protein
MIDIDKRIAEDLNRQGGSDAGYSFVKSYQACPRRFALENILGVTTDGFKWALKQGVLIHALLEMKYQQVADADLQKYLKAMTEDMDNADERQMMCENVTRMVGAWCDMFLQSDLENYENFRYEVPVKIPLLGGVYMTGILDKIYDCKRTGALIIGDYKSTKLSVKQMDKQTRQGDQFTLYTHAVKQMFLNRRVMVVVDIMWGRQLKAGFIVDVGRMVPLMFTQDQLDQTVVGYTGLVLEIAQKVKSYHAGEFPLEFLFPRNGSFCGTFGCPYEEICRSKVTKRELVRHGMEFNLDNVERLCDFAKDIDIKHKEFKND